MRARRVLPGVAARGTAAAVLLAAALLVPMTAEAHRCDRTDNDRAEATRVLVGLTREIDAMERAIVEALRLQTGQLSGYTAQSARAVTGALDSQTRLQAQIAREAAETGAMRGAQAEPERLRGDHRADQPRRDTRGNGARAGERGGDGDRTRHGRPGRGGPARRRRR